MVSFPPHNNGDWLRRSFGSPASATGASALLLLGWEATLAPDPAAWPQPTPPPSEVVELLTPVLDRAIRSLPQAGHPVPSAVLATGLGPALATRLASIYTIPVALGRSAPGLPERSAADRLAQRAANAWAASVTLFLSRLEADRDRLALFLALPELPPVTGLSASASDIHGPAGSVIAVHLETRQTVFYKPRPVTGEQLWADLNAAIHAVDSEAAVPFARILPGRWSPVSSAAPPYGWMTELQPAPCEGQTYWARAGSLLCLADHTCLSDLHSANIIATSAGPAVLDAECLGDPTSSAPDNSSPDRFRDRLLSTGLLPHPGLPDISGLFGTPAPIPGLLLPVWSQPAAATPATLHFAPAHLLAAANRPAAPQSPILCLPDIVAGYLRTARALLSIRPTLLARAQWLDRLDATHAPRIVLRSTLSYGLRISDLLLAEITGLPHSAPTNPDPHPATRTYELRALAQLHIPSFRVSPGSRTLATGDGVPLLPGALPCTPAAAIRQRLRSISLRELEHTVPDALASIFFHARSHS